MKTISQALGPENEAVMSELDRRMDEALISELVATQDFDYCKERGDEWYKAGIYETALNHYTACIQINSKNAEALNSRGMTLYQLKRYEESLLDYTSAAALKPEFSFFYNRGIALIKLKQYQEALADFTRAVVLNPWDISSIRMMIKLRIEANVGCEVPYF